MHIMYYYHYHCWVTFGNRSSVNCCSSDFCRKYVIADFLNIVSVYFIYIARLHCLYSSLFWDVMSLPLSKPLSEILGTEGKLSMICEVAGSDCLVVLWGPGDQRGPTPSVWLVGTETKSLQHKPYLVKLQDHPASVSLPLPLPPVQPSSQTTTSIISRGLLNIANH